MRDGISLPLPGVRRLDGLRDAEPFEFHPARVTFFAAAPPCNPPMIQALYTLHHKLHGYPSWREPPSHCSVGGLRTLARMGLVQRPRSNYQRMDCLEPRPNSRSAARCLLDRE